MSWATAKVCGAFTYMHICITKPTSQLGLIALLVEAPEVQQCQPRRLITFSCWLWVQITQFLCGRVCPVGALLEVVDVISPWVSLNPL